MPCPRSPAARVCCNSVAAVTMASAARCAFARASPADTPCGFQALLLDGLQELLLLRLLAGSLPGIDPAHDRLAPGRVLGAGLFPSRCAMGPGGQLGLVAEQRLVELLPVLAAVLADELPQRVLLQPVQAQLLSISSTSSTGARAAAGDRPVDQVVAADAPAGRPRRRRPARPRAGGTRYRTQSRAAAQADRRPSASRPSRLPKTSSRTLRNRCVLLDVAVER